MFSRVIALFALASLGTLAQAQMPRALTIEEAIQIGLENSKILRQSASRVAYADARAAEVSAQSLPSLKVAGGYTNLSNLPPFVVSVPLPPPFPNSFTLSSTIRDNYSMRATIQDPLFTGFRLDASKDAADYTVEATSQDYSKDKSDLIYNIKSAYWAVFRARELKKLADENVAQIQAHLNDVKNLMDQGMATTNDMLAVEVQLSNGQLNQVDANNNVQLALVALDNTLGIPLSTDITIASPIADSLRHFAGLDSLIQAGLEVRPEIKGMDARVRAGEAGVTAARAGWWPQIFLTGNYYYANPNPRLLPAQAIWKDSWDVGVSVTMDIWNWGTTVHQTDEAQAQLAQARDAYSQTQDAVTLDITQAFLTLKQARERVSVSRQGMERAEENRRVTNQRYTEGLVLNSEMIDAQYALNQAKTVYTQSLVDFELAQARLEKTIGH
ncbi:MAG TPA: TolC family protein [Bacteroidota bacterium]|nr:TolC family protein [Bacteroidota bacterium]